jgi:hypothetical protein
VEAVKAWAKSLFILAVFSSTVLLVVPKSMLKQARFVAEMLLLLCVIAPLGGLLGAAGRAALLPEVGAAPVSQFSLEKFYAEETARRVTEIGARTGIPVDSVKVVTKDSGFTLVEVTVYLAEPAEEDQVVAFRAALGAYLGVQKDRVKVVLAGEAGR